MLTRAQIVKFIKEQVDPNLTYTLNRRYDLNSTPHWVICFNRDLFVFEDLPTLCILCSCYLKALDLYCVRLEGQSVNEEITA